MSHLVYSDAMDLISTQNRIEVRLKEIEAAEAANAADSKLLDDLHRRLALAFQANPEVDAFKIAVGHHDYAISRCDPGEEAVAISELKSVFSMEVPEDTPEVPTDFVTAYDPPFMSESPVSVAEPCS